MGCEWPHVNRRFISPLLFAAQLLLSAVAPSFAVDGYVLTKDDVEYFGAIDSRTSDTHLWLRVSRQGMTIRRSVPWASIAEADLDGTAVAVGDFRAAALAAAELARKEEAENSPIERTIEPDGSIRLTIRGQAPRTTFPADPPAIEPRIESLQIDAFLANWDADVEPDGLIVRFTLVDRAGQPIAADATLDIDLWATRQYAFSEKPMSGGQSVETISRWSKFVRAGEFNGGGSAEIRLPFQAIDPEQLRTIGRYGLVHVRAAIAGHGVFDASVDGIRLRTFAPNRDQLQRFGQDRWLPAEQRGLYRP